MFYSVLFEAEKHRPQYWLRVYTYDVCRYLETWQVFHILVLCVYDVRKFFAIHNFFINIHGHLLLEKIWMVLHCTCNDASNCRAPRQTNTSWLLVIFMLQNCCKTDFIRVTDLTYQFPEPIIATFLG